MTKISSTIVNKVDDNGEKIIAVEQPVAVEPVKINQKEQVTKNQKQIEEQNIENRDVKVIIGEVDGKAVQFDQQLCDALRKKLLSYENILDEMYMFIESNF